MKGPMFKWFGAKWNASKHYPAPKYKLIVEPFAGSACYSLRHAKTHRAVLWDTCPEIAQLWRWLIGEARPRDVLAIPVKLEPFTDIRKLWLSDGQQLLLKHWQRTNPQTACWTTSPWGHLPGQWTENTRTRVAAQLPMIKHWEFRELKPDFEVEATWFVDPPYQHNYDYKLPPIDYAALAHRVLGLHGQVIVCEALHPKTGETPYWLPFKAFRETVTSRRKAHNSHHSRELIYLQDRSSP